MAVCLRVDAVQRSRKRDRLPDVIQSADPSHSALDTHAEAAVRDAAVLAQVEVPLEGSEGKVVVFDALLQKIIAVDTLRAADDLAVTFRREHVNAESLRRVRGIGLHVEGLDGRGVAVDHHWAIELR